jgi:archaellum biogenesis ATPase FlaH
MLTTIPGVEFLRGENATVIVQSRLGKNQKMINPKEIKKLNIGNPEFEAFLIGSYLEHPENLSLVLENLEVADFSSQRHQKIFEASKLLYKKGEPVDYLSLKERLEDQGISVSNLIDIESQYIDGISIEHYIHKVKLLSQRRKFQAVLGEIENSSIEFEEILSKVRSILESDFDLSRKDLSYESLNLPSSLQISQLDIHVQWLVDNLIPKESITLLHSIGGVGKSYLMYRLANSVANGEPFFSLSTNETPVYYLDFENPLSEIADRLKKIGGSQNVKIWHLSHEQGPIRFDDDEWEIYKSFPPGLFIVDSLRSSHLLDENSSKDAAFIMARLKELRSIGHTIILIHHETKLGTYRGSTAWFDLSDHILKFSRVRNIGSNEDVLEDDFSLPIRLGLGGKSRFSAAISSNPMFFRFIDEQLTLIGDPDLPILRRMATLFDVEIYYNEFWRAVQADDELKREDKKGELRPMSKDRFDRLVNKGHKLVGLYWKKEEIPGPIRPRVKFIKSQSHPTRDNISD